MRIWFNNSILLAIFLIFAIPCLAAFSENVWDLDIPIPSDDPLWTDVQDLWNHHWDKKNIDELIATLQKLASKHSDKIEPQLWLARTYYLKARYNKNGREDNFKESEKYAVNALGMDSGNITAAKLLMTSVASYAAPSYMDKTYGDIFRKSMPLKTGRALSAMEDNPEFMAVLPEWDHREDIEKAIKAVTVFNKIADAHPDNVLAQLWTSRGYYYLGYYYLSLDQFDQGLPFFEKGRIYGEKALELSPYSVPAHYWMQLNLSRTIQNANLFVKARYLKPLMSHLVFIANENLTYYYTAPMNSISTILEKGGWVAAKGLGIAGYTMDTVTTATELSVRAFPTYFYTHFARAEVYFHNGETEKAKDMLNKILEMDPYVNPYHAAENICVQRLVRIYLKENYGK